MTQTTIEVKNLISYDNICDTFLDIPSWTSNITAGRVELNASLPNWGYYLGWERGPHRNIQRW